MNRNRIVLVFFLVAVMAAMCASAQSQETSAQQKIDAVFSAITSPDAPGLAVLVRQNGKTVFERGYGVRDLRTKAKIDARTNFRLASCTKQFTAMAIMLLRWQRKLRYDEPLTEISPDFPAYGRNITVKNLLNHTSGLPDYEDLMDALEKVKGPVWTPEHQIQDAEVLELLEKESKGKFAPGTSWSYSNSGYVLLGLIVARTSGKSYGKFLREHIFAPLKMNHTMVYEKGKNEVVDRAFGHSKGKDSGSFEETDQSPTSATLGDGGIYSNLEDLAKWDDALAHFTLLKEKEMLPAVYPWKLNDGSQPYWPAESSGDNLHPGEPVSYGFGWFLDPYRGYERTWHTGSTMGFRTVIQRFRKDNLTIIILCNRTDLDPEKLSLQIANLLFDGR